MKNAKLFTLLIAIVLLSAITLLNAQRVGFSVNVHSGGGYYGGGYYGGYNHHGYAGRPYRGVATGPIGYGPRNRCSWDPYWHQWRCW